MFVFTLAHFVTNYYGVLIDFAGFFFLSVYIDKKGCWSLIALQQFKIVKKKKHFQFFSYIFCCYSIFVKYSHAHTTTKFFFLHQRINLMFQVLQTKITWKNQGPSVTSYSDKHLFSSFGILTKLRTEGEQKKRIGQL